MGRRVARCRMELRTGDASRVPFAATIEPGLSITAGASSDGSTAGMPRRVFGRRSCPAERIEIRRRRMEHCMFAVRIVVVVILVAACPRGRWPARDVAFAAQGRRGRGRRARGLLDPRRSAVRRARPERELDVRHGEVAANEVWRGRRGRRRNRTEGARCKEAVPAGSADCDRARRQRRRLPPPTSGADATAVATATRCPTSCAARARAAPDRDEGHKRAGGKDADVQRQPAVQRAGERVSRAVRRVRSLAAYRPSPEACRQAVQRISTCGRPSR